MLRSAAVTFFCFIIASSSMSLAGTSKKNQKEDGTPHQTDHCEGFVSAWTGGGRFDQHVTEGEDPLDGTSVSNREDRSTRYDESSDSSDSAAGALGVF